MPIEKHSGLQSCLPLIPRPLFILYIDAIDQCVAQSLISMLVFDLTDLIDERFGGVLELCSKLNDRI